MSKNIKLSQSKADAVGDKSKMVKYEWFNLVVN